MNVQKNPSATVSAEVYLLRRKIKKRTSVPCDSVSSANRQERLEGTRSSNSTGMSDLSETAAAHSLHVIAGRIMGLATNWQPPLPVLSQKYRETAPPPSAGGTVRMSPSGFDHKIFHQANLEHQQQTGRLGETKHGWRGNA